MKFSQQSKRTIGSRKISKGANAARNKVVRLIEKAKKEAIINEIDNSKLNSRVLWKTLKNIFPTKAKQMSRINSLTKDWTIFNEHFISIADNIIDNTINTEPDLTSFVDFVNRKKSWQLRWFQYTHNFRTQSFRNHQITPIKCLTGLDGISSSLLKLIAPAVAPSLAKVINCSIINSICPAQLKLARVTPIYKQGSKTDLDNYRPISVLPVISKLLEKHVCKHFIAFLTNHNLLYKCQSGFRANHLTSDIPDLTSDIRDSTSVIWHPTSDIRHPRPQFVSCGQRSNCQSMIKMAGTAESLSADSMAEGSPGNVRSDTPKLRFLKSCGFLKQRS